MPTAEQVKNFIISVILPVAVGAAAAWIVASVHVLNTFGITEGQIAGELTLFGTWAVTTGITWLHAHNVLLGVYTPAAKAAKGRR